MDPVIRSDRLALRHATPDAVDAVQRCIHDPRVHRNVAPIPPAQPREVTRAWIETQPAGREADTDHVYAITAGGEFSGVIGLHRSATAEPFAIGYWLDPAAWGRGYATEAGRAMIDALERSRGPQRVDSGYFLDNPASGHILRKLGFRRVGENTFYCARRDAVLPHAVMDCPAGASPQEPA